MSIFGKIKDFIFNAVQGVAHAVSESASQSFGSGSSDAAPAAGQVVDIEVILTEKAAHAGQKLNWRTSIVDLMKLVGMESSLAERKELAAELGYTGDTSDTATMNIWLHKQVMKKLAENGGKVPADLLD